MAMSDVAHVLVVDDEEHIREVVQYALEREGFRVTAKSDGAQLVAECERLKPDLVILDIMLPGPDGLELCRRLRAHAIELPLLFLSARSDELDRVLGLELGGDDYLTKPFSPRELVARVRAILRRARTGTDRQEQPASVLYRHGDIVVDVDRHECSVGGESVSLTPTELALLAALLERPGIVLSRGQLVERGYSSGHHITERAIDTHIKRIRAKFRDLGASDPFVTVHGVGYKMSGA